MKIYNKPESEITKLNCSSQIMDDEGDPSGYEVIWENNKNELDFEDDEDMAVRKSLWDD